MELQSGNAKFGSQSAIFLVPCDLEIWRMTLKDNTAPLLCSFELCVSFHSLLCKSKWHYSPEPPNLGQNRRFFVPCDLEIWHMTLKNNGAPLLCYFKLSASLHNHLWIQNGVRVRKCSIWDIIGDFLSRVTLKFDGWPWIRIGHLFYATSSFVLHSIAIREFKCSSSPETPNLGQNRWFLVLCDLDLWPLSLW